MLTRNGTSIDSMLWNRTLPIDGGDYVIAARAPGYETWQKTVHVPMEGAKLRVDVPALAKDSRVTVSEKAPPSTPSSPSAASPTEILNSRPSRLTISIPDRSRLGGLVITRNGMTIAPDAWNQAVRVEAGQYIIAANAPEHETWTTTIDVKSNGDEQSVTVPQLRPMVDPRRKFEVGLAGAAVIGALAAGGFEVAGRLKLEEYHNTSRPERDGYYDTANRYHHIAQGCLAGAGLAGAVAAYLLLTGRPHARSSALVLFPWVTVEGGGLSLAGAL